MEPIVSENSDKNIPVHDNTIFRKLFLDAVTTFDRTLRFAANFFLHPELKPKPKNWYGFKSNNPAPHVKELQGFREDLLLLSENLEFRNTSNEFMRELNDDIEKINETNKVIVKADKTSNRYLMEKDEYIYHLQKNVQQDYKIESKENVEKVHKLHADIVTKLEIQERVFKTIPREAFITVKDHKEDFPNNMKCRLINPAKPDTGKISKKILENVIFVVKSKGKYNHWRNTQEVITWFKGIKD